MRRSGIRHLVVALAVGAVAGVAVADGAAAQQNPRADAERELPSELAELEPVFREDPGAATPLLLAGAREMKDAARANRWIELARLLRGMDDVAAREAGLAAVEEEAGDAGAALRRLEVALEDDPAEGSAPGLAALAALVADASPELDGTPFRTRLVEEYLDSPEGPEAALLLARSRMDEGTPRALEDARELAEELVVARPDHPLVPDARRILEALSDGAP